MKKLFCLVSVLAAAIFVSSSVFAAVNKTYKSVAIFSGGEISFDMVLKFIDGDTDADSIAWDVENIPLNVTATNWTTSTVYGVITSTITTGGSAIYMYQNNKNGTDYIAVSSRTAWDGEIELGAVYSGMVNKETKGGDYRGYIPMVYYSTTTKAAPVFGENPEDIAGTRYFIDKSDYNFAAQTNYITVANNGGIVGGVDGSGACWNIGSNTGYMYFGGLFSNVLGGDDYGTDKIKVVSTIE